MSANKEQKGADLGVSKKKEFVIAPPDIRTLIVELEGTAPLMIAKFSKKAREMMRDKMSAGSTARKGRVRTARNFEEDYMQARHLSEDGWDGLPAGAFRNALISACRLVGFKMTLAKLSLFIEADGFDADEGTPLVRIHGTPEKSEMTGRNADGSADIRVRPLWRQWGATLRIRYDAGQFTDLDVMHLISRVGMQVGVGEGRPDSKNSAGLGFGTFRITEEKVTPLKAERKKKA